MSRPGHTVIELLIALGIGAIVMALAAMIGFRHQRFHRDVVLVVERGEQLDQLVALMPISLRSIAPREGDIAPGGARDTMLEFRATIATGVACDSATSTLALAPLDEGLRLTSTLTRPQAGDTAWILAAGAGAWLPHPIVSVSDSALACRIGSTLPYGLGPRVSLAMRLASPAPPGSRAVRITRPWRYSLYRASDGGWYLGAKEWNPPVRRFNTVQPVAGPVLSAAKGGLRFRYFDSLGAELPGIPSPDRIAIIEVAFRVDSAIPGAYSHGASVRPRARTVVAIRNR